MKTISAFTEAAIDSPYVDVIRLIEITIGSITLYLCDRIFGDDDLCAFNGQLYEPLIASWSGIAMGRIDPVTYEPEPSSAGFSVINSQPVGGVNSFSTLFAANDPQYCPVLISEIHEGASNADDKEDIFKGGIEDLPGMTVDLVNVSCTGYELTVANKFIHTIVDDTSYPGSDPDDIGKMVPQIYGTVNRSPGLAVDAGGRTTIAESMSATSPANGYTFDVTDASALPGTGAFTVQVDTEQIRISSRSGNTLTLVATGARGYNSTTAAPHDLGAQLSEIQSDYVYMLADHAVYDIDAIYVDSIRQIIGAQPDEHTVLLLHANGDDASADFPDEGSTIHSVTANGNAQVDTAQKVFGTGSLLVDGTGDYLSILSHADWAFGTDVFTIDFRIKFNTYADKTSGIFNCGVDGNERYSLFYYNAGAVGKLRFYATDGTVGNLVVDLNWISNPSGWYHIAVIRVSDTYYIFVDGTSLGNVTSANSDIPANTAFDIGRSLQVDPYDPYVYLDGWIDEFRVSKGVSRWSAAFTVPPQAYPYATNVIPDSYTKFLIQADGADASTDIEDQSVMAHTVSPQGNAQVDTAQKVFGTGSLLLDGTGDYLRTPNHADWDFGSGEWTIDFRIRLNVYASRDSGIFKIGDDGNTLISLHYSHNGSAGSLILLITDGSGQMKLTASWLAAPSGWYHMAIVRSGNTYTIWIDGTSVDTASATGSIVTPVADYFEIGRAFDTVAYALTDNLDGWIDEFRISKGVARWTSAFTPPTLAYRYGDSAGGGSVTITVYTGQSGDEYAGYPGKAVVVFSVLPTLEKQINLDVTDSGHTHGSPPGDSGTANVSLTGNSTAETIIGNKISADLDGYLDDGSGTYTGTPNALIERPDHISKHVIIVCCGLTTTEIHAASYTAAGTFFNSNNYILGFAILQRPNVRKLLHRIAAQAKSMQFWGAGKHHISPIETSPSMDKSIDDNRVDLGQVWLKYTDRINIKNKLTARFSRQWSGHVDDIESDRAIVIASDATSIAAFGTLQGDPESYPYVNGETQAQAVLNWKLSDSKASRLIAELAGGYYLSDIERGDIVRLDNMEVLGEDITTGYLITIGGDYLTTLAGDRLLWWSTTAAESDEFLKAALLGLITMGTTLFRIIDKNYRPDAAIQIEAVKI